MVVAEVPLWVVHSNNAAAAAPGPNNDVGAASSTSDKHNYNNNNNKKSSSTACHGVGLQRASDSLMLLDDNFGKSGGLQKAAIYSVDVHGAKFATGGGDGTVRIWNTNALFPKPKTMIKSHYNKRMPPPTIASPSSSVAAVTADPNNTTMNTVSGLNNYDSSGESSQEELVLSPNSSPGNSQQVQQPEKLDVHDLSSVVRRKKGGDNVAAKGTSVSAASAESKSSSLPPPTSAVTANSNNNDNENDNNNNSNNEMNQQQDQQQSQTHPNSSTNRLLCTLSAHTGSSVLAVRFSNNGKYLASAGDDAVVCIYAQQHQQRGVGGGSVPVRGNLENIHSSIVEHWVRIKVCRGHGLDVVGLAWAPDDSHLVSCSLDSNAPIIVWKLTDLVSNTASSGATAAAMITNYSNILCNPYKVLGKGIHTSTVKGVTFDPAGTYLASSGDDPAVCIWRAHDDWGLEKRIDSKAGIFRNWNNSNTVSSSSLSSSGVGGNKNGLQTLSSQSLFRRLSWSTDGSYICTTNAVVKNKNVASTISREGWAVTSAKSTATGAVNLVGHKQPVVASRHCPYLLNVKQSSSSCSSSKSISKQPQSNSTSTARGDNDDDSSYDNEPEYSTLLALGDKRGFVTVWSTRKSRPIFKIQCSETRCTVTDLSWGRLPTSSPSSLLPNNINNKNNTNKSNRDRNGDNDGDLILIVSLLDGQVVALRFSIPDEFGRLLKPAEQARVFELRYGIDMTGGGLGGGRRLFVGDNSGPNLIENPLQFSFENRIDDDGGDDESDESNEKIGNNDDKFKNQKKILSSEEIRAKQSESRSKGGKKRIQPLLMQTTSPIPPVKKTKFHDGQSKSKKMADTLESAMEMAEKAASGAAAVAAAQKSANKFETDKHQLVTVANSDHAQHQNPHQSQQPSTQQQPRPLPTNIQLLASAAGHSSPQIPHSTDRIHTVELPVVDNSGKSLRYVADCTNSIQVPKGSSGTALPCTVLSISKTGQVLWKDQLLGSSCSAIAASKSWLVLGTSDGCVQVYGTSPTLGWTSGSAFRSHPPFVFGRPIVALHLRERPRYYQQDNGDETKQTELLVVASDGMFAVYVLEPRFKLQFKGTILPAMTHMLLSADLGTDLYLPKMARIQLTEKNRLLLLLSLYSATAVVTNSSDDHGRDGTTRGGRGGTNQPTSVGAGGSLQGFVYDLESELWMRVADSRFVLSDFYSTLPSTSSKKSIGPSAKGDLSRIDDFVRMGSCSSTLQRMTSRNHQQNDEYASKNDISSRSHCEDRMACSVALGSSSEFEYWFKMYVKILAITGNESLLRLVIDMLLGKDIETTKATPAATIVNITSAGGNGEGINGGKTEKVSSLSSSFHSCWWLSESTKVLKYDRVNLVRDVVIPEMSKNRGLQRITNEISIEIDSLAN